jgi:hypothetical protein
MFWKVLSVENFLHLILSKTLVCVFGGALTTIGFYIGAPLSTRQENIMTIQDIASANRRKQREAERLNQRAGETLFKVYSLAEMIEWISKKLAGARKLSEISNSDDLLLPAPDENLVLRVLRENPDTIFLCGRMVAVEYGSGTPVVRMDFRGENFNRLQNFPAGVYLPGGREVRVCASIEGQWNVLEALSSQFIPKAREVLNRNKWERFNSGDGKPVISLPNLQDPSAQIPEICEYKYGNCAITQTPLVAFGTLTYNKGDIWEKSGFRPVWFESKMMATTQRIIAEEVLIVKKAESGQMSEQQAQSLREKTRSEAIWRADRERRESERRIQAQVPIKRDGDGRVGLASLGDAFAKAGIK